jgi:oligopeptide transport system permease protein
MARLVRGQVLAALASPYVEAARTVGSRGLHLVRRHVLPNSMGPVVMAMVFGIPSVVFLEAFLSFVSVGLRPPAPSWGVMIADGSQALFSSPLQVAVPVAAVGLATLSFNLVGDGLRDALSPRS